MTAARPRVTSAEALNGELRSPLAGVPNRAWNKFVEALMINDDFGPVGRTRPFDAITHAGRLGCFGMLPRRLVDLKVLKEVTVADGKAVATKDKRLLAFLANPIAQYKAFVVSLKLYNDLIERQHPRLATLPAGMSRSGALALHHRLGPRALIKWQQHQQPSTIALYKRSNNLF